MRFLMHDTKILPLSDVPELAEICAAWSFAEWGCQSDQRNLHETISAYKESLSCSGLPKTWVAIRKGKPAGMARLKDHDHPIKTDVGPWLASVFVHPEHRSNNIAKQLCFHVEKQAREGFNFSKLYLFTHTAERLYEKLGWKKVAVLDDYTGLRSEGDSLMLKDLI